MFGPIFKNFLILFHTFQERIAITYNVWSYGLLFPSTEMLLFPIFL